MRKLLLFVFVLGLGVTLIAQQRALTTKEIRNKAVKETPPVKGGEAVIETIPGENFKSILAEDPIGETFYDLQTNTSMQERIYLHSDGSLGGVWTKGPEGNPGGADRGTGYNYHDGNAWGPFPAASIESGAQAGWPSYTTYGENGEAYTCHDYLEGTILGTRTERGTGDWNLIIQAGPTGAEDISFPRVASSGPDNDVIHILSTTWVAYNGQEKALLYARTIDGGSSWEVENQTFDNLGPDDYLEIGPDIYDWADPQGDNLAFLLGDNWIDLILMKSTDNGDSWEETIIWECPYPLNAGTPTDTFYCPDGSHDLSFDNEGKIHIAFSLTRGLEDGAGASYFPGVDGVVYWNEDMPPFSNDINALNPYGHPDSELIVDYNLIGWSQDVDGNGSIDILDEWGYYNTGLSSQPQIVVDDMNRIFVIYASVTEGYNNGVSNYRHLWVRASPNGGEWWGEFHDMNNDLIYIFDECVFPSASSSSDDYIHFTYQADNEPGASEQGVSTIVNTIRYMKIDKAGLISGVAEQSAISESNVSQNSPNPFSGTTTVYVSLHEPAELSLEVTNLTGQQVYQIPAKKYPAGNNKLMVDAKGLTTGIYFYTVRSGNNSVSKKMIVE